MKPDSKKENEVKKLRKSFKFGPGNLRAAKFISIDETLSRLMTSTGAELIIKNITKEGAKATIRVPEKQGFTLVEVDEFLNVLAAPARVRKIAKAETAKAESGEFQMYLANISVAFNETEETLRPLTSETIGLIKQSIALLRKCCRNYDTSIIIAEKFPDDPLKTYFIESSVIACQVVAAGILSLMTGENTVSESNQKKLEEYKLPLWTFNKLTKELTDKNKSPYLFFFPRKKAKSIRFSTKELRDEIFVKENRTVLARSGVLITAINMADDDDNSFLNAVINLKDYLEDDAQKEIFLKQTWTAFPLLESDETHFLEVKSKTVTETVSEPNGPNLKKKLEKVNNALLRTAQLENSAMQPEKLITKRMFPTSSTNFAPVTGVNFYELMAKEPDHKKVICDFLWMKTALAVSMWSELFATEMRTPNTAAIKAVFAAASGMNLKTKVREEGSETFPEQKARLDNEGDTPELIDHKIDRWDLIFEDKGLKDGDPNYPVLLKNKNYLFKISSDEEKLDEKHAKEKRSAANTELTKSGRSLARMLGKKFGKKAQIDVESFLTVFTSVRLQTEALKRIRAAVGQSLRDFLEEEEPEDFMKSPDDDEDENIFADIKGDY